MNVQPEWRLTQLNWAILTNKLVIETCFFLLSDIARGSKSLKIYFYFLCFLNILT